MLLITNDIHMDSEVCVLVQVGKLSRIITDASPIYASLRDAHLAPAPLMTATGAGRRH